jgi:hypothetical protein
MLYHLSYAAVFVAGRNIATASCCVNPRAHWRSKLDRRALGK